jgi:predicted nucleotidyltransferase
MQVNLRDSVPVGHSHEQRMELARQLASLILEEHDAAVAAIVIFGTTAIGLDGPYSDLDVTVVTQSDLGHHSQCYLYDRLQINLDYQNIEESLAEASEPHMRGCWITYLPLYDPENGLLAFNKPSRTSPPTSGAMPLSL